MTDEQVDDFVARYMPAYELWSAGVRDRTAPWAGAGLAVRIDAGRKVVGIERF
jgi:pantothenate kinase-related protein Tda10